MKEYDITITETLEKVVSVTAASKEEAEEKVRQGYYNSEYVLYAEDFTHVDFKAGEGRDIAHEAGKIDVLMVRPGKHPQEYQVGTELEDFQAAIGGDIEIVFPFSDPAAAIICCEDGKLQGMPLNRALRDEIGRVQDIISGSFLVVGLTEDDFTSLSPEQMEKYEKLYHTPESFVKMGRGMLILPMDDDTVKEREKAAEKVVTGKSKSVPERDTL